jgi:hypothetical protein
MWKMTNARVRKSQLLAPFGVGAMLDLPEEALMLMGLENWPNSSGAVIRDARLGRRLKVTHFREPATIDEEANRLPDDRVMHFTRFPRWYFCSRCRQMKRAEIASSSPPRCDGQYKPCIGQSPKMVPVRFVIACDNGHIDDFPWEQWAHTGGSLCSEPKLRLKQTRGAGLAGLRVECTNLPCQKLGATLSTAGGKDALKKIGCNGHRPWLGRYSDVKESCDKTPQMIQRGASNAYFSRLVTSILIPPFSKKLFKILDSLEFQELKDRIGTTDGRPNDQALFAAASVMFRVSEDDLREAYFNRSESEKTPSDKEISEESYRLDEYEAFKGAYLGESQDDLRLQKADLSLSSTIFRKKVSSIVLIDKLVETRCLTGFTRLDPGSTLAPLAKTRQNWLPAIAGTGEGVFLELDQTQLLTWASQPKVINRIDQMQRRARSYELANRRSGESVTPQFVLLHTLAHAIARRLSFDCGYGSSSIRERIYSSALHNMAGILLYTSESGGEGTLGGLVSMGEPRLFEQTFFEALNDTAFCSNDPLCEESSGQGPGGINLAACQGCCLIPETSCEESNFFLDRVLIVGTAEDPDIGFFSDCLDGSNLRFD